MSDDKTQVQKLMAAAKRINQRRSLLEELGNPEGGVPPEPFVPWFKDDEKLLAAVVLRARNSESYARKLIDAAASLAGDDKRLRGRLRKALLPASKARRGRAAKPDWFLMMLASCARHLENQNTPPGKIEETLGHIHHLSNSRIRALVARGKKLLGDDWI